MSIYSDKPIAKSTHFKAYNIPHYSRVDIVKNRDRTGEKSKATIYYHSETIFDIRAKSISDLAELATFIIRIAKSK